jgi:predicted amidohydrolase YtcJ
LALGLLLTNGVEAGSVLYGNAVIWTGDPAQPWAEAMLVEDSRIMAVGTRVDLSAQAGAATRFVDLAGHFVCPGLVDAHAHVLGFGLSLERVDLVGTQTLDETVDRVRTYIVGRREEGFTGWIRGRGWDQNDWPVTKFPSRQDLDQVSENYPVVLTRIDGHAMWANSRALSMAGISANTADPEGGRIHRDASGNPTGILVDTAKELLVAAIPETEREIKARAIRRATRAMAQVGLTGAHDMGMSVEELELYRELAGEDRLEARIYGALSSTDPQLRQVLDRGPDREWQAGRFKLGMVKFYVDGALGSRGAALLAAYSDEPGNEGLLIMDGADLVVEMKDVLNASFQCAVHAIGDRGNRVVLDSWEKILEERADFANGHPVPIAPLSRIGDRKPMIPPVRLEHAQVIHRQDLYRVGKLGVLASMQPTHCTSDMPWAPDRLGRSRLAGAYAWRTLIAGGAVLAAGSDFPVESHNPLLGIYAAVSRRQPDGKPVDGWAPEQRLTRDEAIASFTAAPAYASGDLHQLGTLSAGKLADFVVFDRNLVTCDDPMILEARALLTVVGGSAVWVEPGSPFAETIKPTR